MSDWIKQVAWVSERIPGKPVSGVVLVFHGLGSPNLRTGPASTVELELIRAGALVVARERQPRAKPQSREEQQRRRLSLEREEAAVLGVLSGLARESPLRSAHQAPRSQLASGILREFPS